MRMRDLIGKPVEICDMELTGIYKVNVGVYVNYIETVTVLLSRGQVTLVATGDKMKVFETKIFRNWMKNARIIRAAAEILNEYESNIN